MPRVIQPAPEFVLCHGDHAVTLRASLRAAVALERFSGGFQGLFHKLSHQNLPALHAVIRASATDRQEAERLIAHTANHPLVHFADTAQAVCLALLSAILTPAEGEAAPPDTADPMPLAEFFTELYCYGTGWLGWPPSEVWNASIAELETAILAHADRLVKLTPGASGEATTGTKAAPKAVARYTAERLRQIEEQGFDPAFDREGLRALKAKFQ